MKRFHVHVSVEDLGQSIAFYSTLFGVEPSVRKDDYAKWALEDPRVNFAISDRSSAHGVDHLGIQVDDSEELAGLAERLKAAGETTRHEAAQTCCYATSDKAWVNDPSGLHWETFYTHAAAAAYGEDDRPVVAAAVATACSRPQPQQDATACC